MLRCMLCRGRGGRLKGVYMVSMEMVGVVLGENVTATMMIMAADDISAAVRLIVTSTTCDEE